MTFATPMCCAIFEQRASIAVSSCEEEIQKAVAAMPIRDNTTILIPCRAAILDFPTKVPSDVVISIPSVSSNLRMEGILILLAAPTATNGTNLPTRGGNDFTKAFKPSLQKKY